MLLPPPRGLDHFPPSLTALSRAGAESLSHRSFLSLESLELSEQVPSMLVKLEENGAITWIIIDGCLERYGNIGETHHGWMRYDDMTHSDLVFVRVVWVHRLVKAGGHPIVVPMVVTPWMLVWTSSDGCIVRQSRSLIWVLGQSQLLKMKWSEKVP